MTRHGREKRRTIHGSASVFPPSLVVSQGMRVRASESQTGGGGGGCFIRMGRKDWAGRGGGGGYISKVLFSRTPQDERSAKQRVLGEFGAAVSSYSSFVVWLEAVVAVTMRTKRSSFPFF